MTALNRVALDVIIDVAGAPMPLVEREVRYASIDFCDFTMAWRVPLDEVPIVGGTSEYEFTLPDDSVIATVFYLGQDGVRLLPTTERVLDDDQGAWRASDSTATAAQWFYLPDRTKVRLALTPSAAGLMGLTVALKPGQTAKTLPDFIFEHHVEALRAGALARLLAQPRKDWSDPQLAYYLAVFDKAKRKEKAERWNDYTRGSTLRIVPAVRYQS